MTEWETQTSSFPQTFSLPSQYADCQNGSLHSEDLLMVDVNLLYTMPVGAVALHVWQCYQHTTHAPSTTPFLSILTVIVMISSYKCLPSYNENFFTL